MHRAYCAKGMFNFDDEWVADVGPQDIGPDGEVCLMITNTSIGNDFDPRVHEQGPQYIKEFVLVLSTLNASCILFEVVSR
jgi:hypothetical protein